MLSSPASIFTPHLPAHCEPTNDALLQLSATFHTCIPTPLAFLSQILGILSILAWLFAQLPQIYKNWSISSTSGLSIFFLVEWCLGDFSNLLGALFTHQASWQVAIGSYYVFVDLCLVGQWLWYERLRHGNRVRKIWPRGSGASDEWSRGEGMSSIEGLSPVAALSRRESEDADTDTKKSAGKSREPARPRIIFHTPTFQGKTSDDEDEKPSSSLAATPGGTTIYRVGPSSPMPSPSPRTVLLIACLIAIARASPVVSRSSLPPIEALATGPTRLEQAGTILSWTSTALYLGSRLPQLLKNWKRKSTAGLSPQLFAAAFCGNLFYSSAILSNPCVWYDFPPYGGGGWAGPQGSERATHVAAALPFFLGAAGVLGLDATVGLQFFLYDERKARIVVVEDQKGRRWRWRQVSGWMRGWIPSISEGGKGVEERGLLNANERHSEGYGAL